MQGLTIDQYGDYALFLVQLFCLFLKEEILQAFQEVFPELMGAYSGPVLRGWDYVSPRLWS